MVAAEARGFLFAKRSDVFSTASRSHAASPKAGRNALLAGTAAELKLHAIARHTNAVTHVNVGRMVAGAGRNIITDECQLPMEVRGDTRDSSSGGPPLGCCQLCLHDGLVETEQLALPHHLEGTPQPVAPIE